MIERGSPLLASMAIATTIVVWATAFPAIKLALAEVEALPLASIRYAIAAVLAAIWLLWQRPPKMPARDLALCAGCGTIAGAAYSVFLNLGQLSVPAGAASFLIKTESLWMAVFAVLFLKESFKVLAWAGTALCVIGVGLIATAQAGGIALDTGAALVLAAALCSAAGFTLQRGLVARHGALHVAAISFLAAALALSPWLPLAVAQTAGASAATVAWVIFLGLLPTTVGLGCILIKDSQIG